jgi:hypothetical protein
LAGAEKFRDWKGQKPLARDNSRPLAHHFNNCQKAGTALFSALIAIAALVSPNVPAAVSGPKVMVAPATRPAARPTVLSMPAPVIEFANAEGQDVNTMAMVRDNLTAAVREWNKVIRIKGQLHILLRFEPQAISRVDTASLSNIASNPENEPLVLEDSAAYKVRTGESVRPGQPDLLIRLNPNYLQKDLWLDPAPMVRTVAVPFDRVDAVSIFTHELFHAFGFNGLRELATGRLRSEHMSRFDRYVKIENSKFTFSGPHTVAAIGRPLELTSTNLSQNLWHHGNSRSDAHTLDSLMNGLHFRRGRRYKIDALDIAIARDLGLPVRPSVSPARKTSPGLKTAAVTKSEDKRIDRKSPVLAFAAKSRFFE